MRRGEAGFTLLEMLVALVVFGLVMAGIAQAFRFGFAVVSAGNRAMQTPEDLAAMDMALRRMIEQAQPDSMKGGAYSLAFTTRLPQGAGVVGGLQDVALQLGPGGGLVLRSTAHPPGLPLGPAPAPQIDILATGVSGVSFSYLQGEPGTGPVWRSQWSGKGLPLLVRMHLERRGRPWPDLIAAPTAQGN
jgi:general secretion pathway protein J